MINKQLLLMRSIIGLLSVALLGLLPMNRLLAEELSATTSWAMRVELSTPVAGVIAQVDAHPGQQLKQGQRLLSLDQRPFEYRIRVLQARIKKSRVLQKEMQAERKRAEELYNRTLLSDHELELAKINATSADADYQSLQAELSTAKLEKEYSNLRAPFNALVLKRQAEKGQVVSPLMKPQVLFVLVSSEKMKARVLLDGDKIKTVTQGQAVKVQLGDTVFQGKVSALGLEPTSDSAGYSLEVEFKTSGKLLRAGQKVKLFL